VHHHSDKDRLFAVHYPPHEIEEHLRREFEAAFHELERAPDREKSGATARLNRAMRRLYDFVGHGKVPKNL